MFLFQIDFRDTLDSLLLTRAWLESDLRTVKRFDSRFKKKEKKERMVVLNEKKVSNKSSA